MPIFLFVLAGAMVTGGVALAKRAMDDMSRDEAQRRIEFEARLLKQRIDLEELRQEAARLGMDPDQVVAGYISYTKGEVTVDQILNLVRAAA